MFKINNKVTGTYSNANPSKRSSFVVNRILAFKYLRALDERLFVAVVTGPVVNIRRRTFEDDTYVFLQQTATRL